MIWRFIDRAKGVAIAAGAASLLALAGVFTLAASAAATLAIWLPWPAALAITAVGFLSVAAIAMWVGVQPSQPDRGDERDRDSEQVAEAAMAMMDLPVEAAKRIVAERPIAAIVLASGFGLLLVRRPQMAMKMAEKIIARFT